jgi:hypothetical protein
MIKIKKKRKELLKFDFIFEKKKTKFIYRKNLQSNGSTAACLLGEIGGLIAFHVPSFCLAMQCIDRNGTRKTRYFKSLIRG